jgi:RNA polymerase sigma-70 factor (ECF subfamily)
MTRSQGRRLKQLDDVACRSWIRTCRPLGLLAVLDPDVALRADAAVPSLDGIRRLTGREAAARAFVGKVQATRAALLYGADGAVFAADSRLLGALEFLVAGDRILTLDVLSDQDVLDALDVRLLDT